LGLLRRKEKCGIQDGSKTEKFNLSWKRGSDIAGRITADSLEDRKRRGARLAGRSAKAGRW